MLPGALKQCKASVQSIENVVKMIKSFTSPWSFIYHVGKDVIVNGKNIINEIETCVTDYRANNFNGMGYEIGEALYQIFIGEEMANYLQMTATETDIVDFFEGVCEGLSINIPSLDTCVSNVYETGLGIA